jgi:cell division protein FtsB
MNRTMTFKGFILIIAAVLVVFLILHSILKGNVDEQSRKQQELRVQLTRLEEENKELLSRLNLAGTDEYIMSNAVKKYSYVKRDAIRFEYTNPEAIYAYSEKELQILMDEMND